MKISSELERAAFKRLPHRYPFLMVDRIIDYDTEKKTITALKNVSHNEPFFQGHFPGNPIMPGVLIQEGLTQTAALFHYLDEANEGDEVYLSGIDKARIKKISRPGDQLIYKLKLIRYRLNTYKFEAEALCDDELVFAMEFIATVQKK